MGSNQGTKGFVESCNAQAMFQKTKSEGKQEVLSFVFSQFYFSGLGSYEKRRKKRLQPLHRMFQRPIDGWPACPRG
jgi:hypothetical protein